MSKIKETFKELSVRIHYDWFHKCRTCKSWNGDRAGISDGLCINNKSSFFNSHADTDEHCDHWDSYDEDTALEVLNGKWDHIHNPNAVRDK